MQKRDQKKRIKKTAEQPANQLYDNYVIIFRYGILFNFSISIFIATAHFQYIYVRTQNCVYDDDDDDGGDDGGVSRVWLLL